MANLPFPVSPRSYLIGRFDLCGAKNRSAVLLERLVFNALAAEFHAAFLFLFLFSFFPAFAVRTVAMTARTHRRATVVCHIGQYKDSSYNNQNQNYNTYYVHSNASFPTLPHPAQQNRWILLHNLRQRVTDNSFPP